MTTMPRGREFTAADLEAMPDDGNRYEIIDGALIVTPSPITRHIDLGLKRSRYEAAGCPSYWVVDPETPSVTAWELREGQYVVAGSAEGEESVVVEQPFGVEVVPARLLD